MPNDRQRRYTDEEVSAILRLTLESGEAGSEASQDGMSLDDLVRVASEAGFSADQIRTAAERLDTVDTSSKKFDLVGCRAYTELVRVVDGEITEDQWDEVVAEVRSGLQGPTGESSKLGKTFEWYTNTEITAKHMSFKPENGRTRMKARLSSAAVPVLGYGVATFLLGVILTGVMKKSGLVPTFGAPTSLAICVGIWLSAMGVVRWAISSWYKQTVRNMKSALDRAQSVLAREDVVEVEPVQAQVDDQIRVKLSDSSD